MSVGATATMTGVLPQPFPVNVQVELNKVEVAEKQISDSIPGTKGVLHRPVNIPVNTGFADQTISIPATNSSLAPIINITINNVTPEKEKEEKKEKKEEKSSDTSIAEGIYWCIELIPHAVILSRKALNCGNSCKPIYLTTYLIAATAGAVFGLSKAQGGKPIEYIAKRAKVFAKSEWADKASTVAKRLILPGALLQLCECVPSAEGLGGNLAAIYWGFTGGAELTGILYKNFENKKEG